MSNLDADLAQRLIDAEEAIYSDHKNPLVNWTPEDLQAQFTAAGFANIHLQSKTHSTLRRITPQQLNHWFNPGGQQNRTYAGYLQQQLGGEELRLIRKLFERELAHNTVQWTSTQAFLRAKCG